MEGPAQKDKKITGLGVIAWSICALFFLYEFFLRTFLGALAHQIIPDLRLTPSRFALLASTFYIAYGLMQIPVGAIGSKYGIKKCLIFACLVCAFASFGFANTHSFIPALIYRFLMGFGGGFAFLILLIATITWFPKSKLAFFVGLGQFIGTMGALIAGGPLAYVVSSDSISWRLVFNFIALFGFLLFILSFIFVRKNEKDKRNARYIIQPSFTLKQKLIRVFTSKQCIYIAFYSAFVFLSAAMLGAVWGTLFLQSVGYTQKIAASAVSCSWLGFAVGCPLLGYLSDIFIRRKPIMIICAAVGLILICTFVYFPVHQFWISASLLFLIGVTSAGQSVGFATITEHVRPSVKPLALGLNSAFITLMAAISPLIVGGIVQRVSGVSHEAVQNQSYVPKDFSFAFTLMPILYLTSLLIAIFLIEETYCRNQKKALQVKLVVKAND